MTDENNTPILPSLREENENSKPPVGKQGGAPGSLLPRRDSFSKSIKKFNKKHCNNRFGK